jgi:hypothetical protein
LPVKSEGFYKTLICRVALQSVQLNACLYTLRGLDDYAPCICAFLNSPSLNNAFLNFFKMRVSNEIISSSEATRAIPDYFLQEVSCW